MLAKTLFFSSPGRLSTRYEQLVYDGEDGVHRTFPIEDLGYVIVETAQMSLSAAVLQKLAAANAALIVCDGSHMPAAQLVAYAGHSTAQETTAAQFAASEAVQGRLWRQLVKGKIRNQAALAELLGHDVLSRRLRVLADDVKNRDEANCEAQAARLYFQALLNGVNRSPDGAWPNSALNYGYAILRAAVARALVGSGLLCIRGIHHHNRYDAFCLADDVMEPYRPYVDQYVLGRQPPFDVPATELTKEMKARLLQMLTYDVRIGDVSRPLSIAVTITAASLAKYYLGKAETLMLPEFIA
ncbi:MAG: type II CRISPR-associated endonuclease Cas1 [Kiritimatiellae bacterium]|nr:type II CRISPR-associated endonuclease Cas1 [Kiritimatiellia bacterium]